MQSLQAHQYDVNNNNCCFSMLSKQTTATAMQRLRKPQPDHFFPTPPLFWAVSEVLTLDIPVVFTWIKPQLWDNNLGGEFTQFHNYFSGEWIDGDDRFWV